MPGYDVVTASHGFSLIRGVRSQSLGSGVDTGQPKSHISRISTVWTVIRQAHADGAGRQLAQSLLVECYGPAVRRYLLKLTGNAEVADELWQQFMTQLIEGGFRNADPSVGRFRAYVKVSLFHLVSKHHRSVGRENARSGSLEAAAEIAQEDEPDDSFDELWRVQLLDRTWDALQQAQPRYYAVLRLRSDHPNDSVERLCERAGEPTDQASQTRFRKLISRARDRFALLLVDEVARSIKSPDADSVENELAHLGLLVHCRDAIEKLRVEESGA